MSRSRLTSKVLDEILNKVISTVDNSKDDIFHIAEDARQEYEGLTKELDKLKVQFIETITNGERLEMQSVLARQRLSEVSRHFKIYTEPQVKEAYEKAHKLQTELMVNRERESELRKRRDDIERRLLALNDTIGRADHIAGQISIILNYLTSDLKQVGEIVEDAIQKEYFGFRIIEAQEEERKRLSREIHDGPAQMLANVMMRSELIERIFRERSQEEALKEIRDLRQMVRSALYEVRHIIYDLRPMALDDLGLVPTLCKYLDTVEEYNNGQPKITFISKGSEKRLPSNLEVALFRLVQESVTNAIKHAEAAEIQVEIDMNDKLVTLFVSDNGKGFEVGEKKERSFGLMGMKERVDLLEGTLHITSKIGRGTLVKIEVPLTNAQR